MKIYTGFGDQGKTSLFGGKVVSKNDPRVNLYGTLDELNSFLGLVIAKSANKAVNETLEIIQNELFVLSTHIAAGDSKSTAGLKDKISKEHIRSMEQTIDRFNEQLPELKQFILPGGNEAAAVAHIARTVCRRAERLWVELNEREELPAEQGVYLNRLSDLLFVIARYLNLSLGGMETFWRGLR